MISGCCSSALATSTICLRAIDSPLTGASRSISVSRRSSTSRQRARSARRSITRKGWEASSRPRNRLSATLSAGASDSSWKTMAMPSAREARASPSAAGSPLTRISPPSAVWMPATILARVDLPDPFSPSSTCTSPASRAIEAPASARVAPNAFLRPRTSRTAGRAATNPSPETKDRPCEQGPVPGSAAPAPAPAPTRPLAASPAARRCRRSAPRW